MTASLDGTAAGKPLGEFGRIARYFAPLAASPGALRLLDDAALVSVDPGYQLVVTADALVEGVHFPVGETPALIARKALRTNLSDLAAKGASPLGYLLSLALPSSCGDTWVKDFAAGLAEDQAIFGITLLGGDSVSTSGPVTISITALGTVPQGSAILRSSGQAGDRVYVTGTIGDGALGLLAATWRLENGTSADRAWLADRYRLPQPRLEVGLRLRGVAHAMMDISDGLAADLGHLSRASGLSARIDAWRVSLSEPAAAVVAAAPEMMETILCGGDDYELLFAAPSEMSELIQSIAAECGVRITQIGVLEMISGSSGSVQIVDADGETLDLPIGGWTHV